MCVYTEMQSIYIYICSLYSFIRTYTHVYIYIYIISDQILLSYFLLVNISCGNSQLNSPIFRVITV